MSVTTMLGMITLVILIDRIIRIEQDNMLSTGLMVQGFIYFAHGTLNTQSEHQCGKTISKGGAQHGG
jgi:hypothetical protein